MSEMKTSKASWFVFVFAVAVFAAPVLAATYQVETDKPEGVYRCGETATFTVTVLDTALRVEAARCSAMPVNIRWPGHQRELDQTEICSFARFDFNGSAEVCVTPHRAFTNVVVRPVSAKVAVRRDGDLVRFTITKAGAYSVEFDGRHRNLMLFADPPHDWSDVDRSAANVRYFGPGEHDAGLITLKAGETLFIDEGAVVYGRVFAKDASAERASSIRAASAPCRAPSIPRSLRSSAGRAGRLPT